MDSGIVAKAIIGSSTGTGCGGNIAMQITIGDGTTTVIGAERGTMTTTAIITGTGLGSGLRIDIEINVADTDTKPVTTDKILTATV